MATYRINISSDEQTITAATYESCITGLSMNLDEEPSYMVDSTGATNGNFTMHCTANAHTNPREWTYRLVYTYNGGACEHNIHLVQEGSGGEHAVISFRGHNCTPDYGTIEIASITLSDGSTIELQGVSESVQGGGGDEHLGTVDVTGNIGKRITGGTVKFNGSIISDYTGLSGTISDGAEFTVTIGNCGGGGTASMTINYTNAKNVGVVLKKLIFNVDDVTQEITINNVRIEASQSKTLNDIVFNESMVGKRITSANIKSFLTVDGYGDLEDRIDELSPIYCTITNGGSFTMIDT